MEKVTARDIAMMIDLSLLNPTFTEQEVVDGLNLAKEYNVVSVCVRPCDVELANEMLKDCDTKVTTVIGFPHGTCLTETKVFETEKAIDQGCVEGDLVNNIAFTLSGEYDKVEADIKAVADAAHAKGALLKVIFENAYLNDEQKVKLCEICTRAGADFTKTATGYAPSGATIHDLKIMRANTPERMQVKAAGGVRTLDAALKVRAVGASRFGCTRTKTIMEEAMKREAEGTLVLPEVTDDMEL
ncbi:MAG: deoxyribose-phosphate aldolase [Lachnospiraceae bacterium]|nr:deoxyribose-phosphate aldolase [Lachnospiraceae bacterium]